MNTKLSKRHFKKKKKKETKRLTNIWQEPQPCSQWTQREDKNQRNILLIVRQTNMPINVSATPDWCSMDNGLSTA